MRLLSSLLATIAVLGSYQIGFAGAKVQSPLLGNTPDRKIEKQIPFTEGSFVGSVAVREDRDRSGQVLQAVLAELTASRIAIDESKLKLDYSAPYVGKYFAPQDYFYYRQMVDGIPVESAGVRAMVQKFSERQQLSYFDYRLADIPSVRFEQKVTAEEAMKLARKESGAAESDPTWKNELVYRYIGKAWIPVYDIQFEGHSTAVSIDVRNGDIYLEDRKHHVTERAIDGAVGGKGILFDPVATAPELVSLPLGYVNVAVGTATVMSDAKGLFQIPDKSDTTAFSAALAGKWATVVASTGTAQKAQAEGSEAVPAALSFNTPILDDGTAQVNGYYHTNVVHDFLAARKVTNAKIDRQVKVTVNIASSCNAYYSGGSINFFNKSAQCVNTSYDTVVYHEYGHLVDDAFGGISNGGLSEGWGDVLAVLITNQPLIGESFFGKTGTFIRHAKNNYIYKKFDEVHKLGQAWVGFVWDLQEELTKKYGAEKAADMTADLVLPSMVSNAFDIPAAVKETLVRNDDDGNLSNGTPDKAEIVAAATRHGLQTGLRVTAASR